jgi:uncharacterized damage-inducible protein DinB
MATSTSSANAFTMPPEAAAGLREFQLGSISAETAATRKVILAITKPDFKIDPNARPAIELAQHIVGVEVQFLLEIADGKFSMEPRFPNLAKDPKALVQWYDAELPKAIAAVRKMTPQQLATNLDFYGAFNFPAVCYLDFAVKHSVHHRGQLSTYLRPMGSKVPSIYGGSFDEPWKG